MSYRFLLCLFFYFQGQSFGWTDEKHNSYIQSLEAAFVQQLHQSGGYTSRNLHQRHNHDSSEKVYSLYIRMILKGQGPTTHLMPTHCPFLCLTSHYFQFTVLQDSCRKILQPKSRQQMDTTNNETREKQRMRNHSSYHLSRTNAGKFVSLSCPSFAF